jgi:hypothetical protein
MWQQQSEHGSTVVIATRTIVLLCKGLEGFCSEALRAAAVVVYYKYVPQWHRGTSSCGLVRLPYSALRASHCAMAKQV